MSGKWTPGPWAADLGETYRICDRKNQTVAWATFVFSSSQATGRRETDVVAANARLIAAAPELAEALEFYANPDVYKPHPHGLAFERRDLSFVARAALAKAKGEPS